MADPLDPHATPQQLADALTIRVFEANLLIRALEANGVAVHVDLVDRVDVVHTAGRTEIIVRTGSQP